MASMAWRASPAATAVKWSNGQWQRQPHLTLISDAIAEMADHPIRLLLSIPPRHGKSLQVDVWSVDLEARQLARIAHWTSDLCC